MSSFSHNKTKKESLQVDNSSNSTTSTPVPTNTTIMTTTTTVPTSTVTVSAVSIRFIGLNYTLDYQNASSNASLTLTSQINQIVSTRIAFLVRLNFNFMCPEKQIFAFD